MERAMLLNHLAQAERHIDTGEQHVCKQRSLIAKLEKDGHDPAGARQLLEQFEEIQAMHIADRDRIRAELKAIPEGRVG
jgi:hypothetical protein